MLVTANIVVKGTNYYNVAELFEQDSLSPGLAVRLEHHPENQYDKNAVAVKVKSTDVMLGHLPKESAPMYATLIRRDKIVEASISKVRENQGYINIKVRIIYDQTDEELAEKHKSRLWLSASLMPSEPGVYAIRNIKTNRQYIGSSNNLKNRINSHLRDLSLGSHANHALQKDFSHLGFDYFEAVILISDISPSNLPTLEADKIGSLLKSGASLYNLTQDGQSKGRNYQSHTDFDPVSDRLAKQKIEAELRKSKEALNKKREEIVATFELKLNTLLPKISSWVYFIVLFLFFLVGMISLFPDFKEINLVMISAVLAFVVTFFIRVHFKEKVKQSDHYQNLIKQRDEQLAELDRTQ